MEEKFNKLWWIYITEIIMKLPWMVQNRLIGFLQVMELKKSFVVTEVFDNYHPLEVAEGFQSLLHRRSWKYDQYSVPDLVLPLQLRRSTEPQYIIELTVELDWSGSFGSQYFLIFFRLYIEWEGIKFKIVFTKKIGNSLLYLII